MSLNRRIFGHNKKLNKAIPVLYLKGGESLKFFKTLTGLGLTIVSSAILILLGIVYFMLTIWIIKVGAFWAGYDAVEGSTVVLTAGIVTAAAMIGSALQR